MGDPTRKIDLPGFPPDRRGFPAVKDRLKRITAEAVERGVFGAPTMFIGDEMFFGQDRLGFVEKALRKE